MCTLSFAIGFAVLTVSYAVCPGTTLPCDTAAGAIATCNAGETCVTNPFVGPADLPGCCQAASTVAPRTVNPVQNTNTSCVDLINPSTGSSDCPSKSFLCKDPVYDQVMRQQCALTCGFCNGGNGTANANCVDLKNPSTGVSDCPARKDLCNNAAYQALMTVQCPATCGRCGAGNNNGTRVSNAPVTVGTCVDKLNPSTGSSDCPSKSYLCSNPVYNDVMTQQCPVTCGRCTPGASTNAPAAATTIVVGK